MISLIRPYAVPDCPAQHEIFASPCGEYLEFTGIYKWEYSHVETLAELGQIWRKGVAQRRQADRSNAGGSRKRMKKRKIKTNAATSCVSAYRHPDEPGDRRK